MRKDTDNDFFRIMKGALIVCAVILFICFACSSCQFFRKLDKQTSTDKNDSTNVKKQTESSSSVDTSKTKTASSKETIFYPQPIYIQGKDGETKVVFVPQKQTETGTEERQNFNYENYMKNFMDSVTIAQLKSELNKKSETKGSLLGIGFWIGIAIVGLVLIGLLLALVHFKNQIVNIKSLINKQTI